MRKMLAVLTAAVLSGLAAPAGAAWWVENDYSIGSKRFQRDSLSLTVRTAPRFTAGCGAEFYKDDAHDLKKAYAFRAPLTYSSSKFILSLKPFIYPASSGTGSSARGSRLAVLLPLSEKADGSYLRFSLGGALAGQRTPLLAPSAAAGAESFSETAVEGQLEKSFYNQFFFQASAAGFSRTGDRNSNPAVKPGPDRINPVMDHSELAYMGAFRPVTALPKMALAAQLARNMAPDYDSYLYAGFSRITFRDTRDANSLLGGIKLRLNNTAAMDLGYNYFRVNGESGENYYKLLIQVFFDKGGR